MASNKTENTSSILITGITPYFLERGVLWFEEHLAEIKKKAREDPWWRTHTIFLEAGGRLPHSPFLRKISDMGYVKVGAAEHCGEFAVRGGVVDVFPINRATPLRIEFKGNTIEGISEFVVAVEAKPAKIALPADPTEYERLWLAGLKSGDYLVHLDHGIGTFRGFEKNYYILEYAPARSGGMPDRLLVPRDRAKKISRYVGFETPTVHRLGGTVWATTKRKAREEAKKLAEELLAVFKKRARATRPPYPRHPEVERELAESFDFVETEDQSRAIEEINADLDRERPMDRLLLGDVGFGKTEVAIRAAARVAYAGAQVALLVPTTVLADQNVATFRERLKNLPLTVAQLTRLTPKRDIKREIEKLKTGQIDIVIGTHRLLSRDIQFKDLGLVIIDEEQRFGVRH